MCDCVIAKYVLSSLCVTVLLHSTYYYCCVYSKVRIVIVVCDCVIAKYVLFLLCVTVIAKYVLLLFDNRSWVYWPALNAKNCVLNWERLAACSDVRIQIITMWEKKKPSGHNTEQMKTGRTEKRKICWVTDLCLIRCEATLVPILTVQSISVDLLSAASRKFLPVFKLLCSVTMHSLFYEDKTHCVTDGSKSKSNPTQKPEITVCKKQNHMEPAMLFCTAALGFLSVRSPAAELSHT